MKCDTIDYDCNESIFHSIIRVHQLNECSLQIQQLLLPINLIVSDDFHKAMYCTIPINAMKQISIAWKWASEPGCTRQNWKMWNEFQQQIKLK